MRRTLSGTHVGNEPRSLDRGHPVLLGEIAVARLCFPLRELKLLRLDRRDRDLLRRPVRGLLLLGLHAPILTDASVKGERPKTGLPATVQTLAGSTLPRR